MKYPILIVKNNFKKKYDFSRGLEWFKKHTPLEITIEEISTSISLDFDKVGNEVYSGVNVGEKVKDELRKIIPRNKYQCVVLLYGDSASGIRVGITDINPLYPETEFIEVVKSDDGGKMFNHEMIHALFMKLKRKGVQVDDPMDRVIVDGQIKFYYNNDNLKANPSNRTIALERLKPHWDKFEQKTMSYKYFTEKEVEGLKSELVVLLDKAREMAGIPFVLNSTVRNVEENSSVGGVPDSAHIYGMAVDIRVRNSVERFAIVNALLKAGFKRVGVGKTFVHCDIDQSKPQNVIWLY